MEDCCIISGNSNQELANDIAEYSGIKLTDRKITNFLNTEICVQILQHVRGKHVFIIQTGSFNEKQSINDYIMELFLLVNACKLSSANSITAIIPCFPYARADKKDLPRTSIGGSLMSILLKKAGVDRIVTMDLHAGQIQGFTDIPFDNIYGKNLISNYISENILGDKDSSNFILVSPDAGGIKRVIAYAESLKMKHLIMHKQRDYSQVSVVNKTIIIGDNLDLADKTLIVIDDIIDTMGTMIATTEELGKYGAKEVIIMATHGIFSGEAINRINNCKLIREVVVTNTLPQQHNQKTCSKIKVIDCAILLGEVIKKLIKGESIASLFC